MRWKTLLVMAVMAAAVGPALVWSQRGPGGGRSRDPNEFFNRLSGGANVIDLARLQGDDLRRVEGMIRWMNIPVTNGQITREAFTGAMQARFGGGRGPGGPGGPAMRGPGGPGGPPGGPPGGDRGGRGPGGPPDNSYLEQNAERWFRQLDRNNDGLLSFEEMSETMQTERDRWDTNKDGFIDLTEYKAYFVARFARPQEGPGAPPGGPAAPGQGPSPAVPEEDQRPVVYRAGKLPKELPSWFSELDTDVDGQVGLYEWRKGNGSIDEFQDMDLNGDGLLTPEEVLRYLKEQAEEAKKKGTAVAVNKDDGGRGPGVRGPGMGGPGMRGPGMGGPGMRGPGMGGPGMRGPGMGGPGMRGPGMGGPGMRGQRPGGDARDDSKDKGSGQSDRPSRPRGPGQRPGP